MKYSRHNETRNVRRSLIRRSHYINITLNWLQFYIFAEESIGHFLFFFFLLFINLCFPMDLYNCPDTDTWYYYYNFTILNPFRWHCRPKILAYSFIQHCQVIQLNIFASLTIAIVQKQSSIYWFKVSVFCALIAIFKTKFECLMMNGFAIKISIQCTIPKDLSARFSCMKA